jgi:prophage regulatory protein
MKQSIEFMRLNPVIEMTGHSRSYIYAAMSRGEFPQSIKIGPRAIAWIRSEIQDYITSRVAASRGRA